MWTKTTIELTEDYHNGDKLDIYVGPFGEVTRVTRHLTAEERKELQKENRIKAIKSKLEKLNEELTSLTD